MKCVQQASRKMQCVQQILLIFTVIGAARTAERSVVVEKKMEKSLDQATSGSEYSFSMNTNGPAEYEAYKNANYNPSSENYGMPPVIPVIPDVQTADALPGPQPGYITRYNRYKPFDSGHIHYEHHYPYPTDYHLPMEMMSKSYGSGVPVSSYGLPISFSVNDYPYMLPQSYKGLGVVRYPSAPGYHGPSSFGSADALNFNRDFGKRYGETERASQGEQGQNGFNSAQRFDKGLSSNFENEGQRNSFNENGGSNSGHFDAAGHYANQNQASNQNQGGSFSQNKGHTKGSKTTGYHKVFYKDEYKKDHQFYDESDQKGKFEKYGNKQVQQSGNSGQFSNGGRQDSGNQQQQAAVSGFSDKAQSLDQDSRFNNVADNQQFNRNSAEFGRKSGESQTEAKGFNEGSQLGGAF